jgi:hypothetical protein
MGFITLCYHDVSRFCSLSIYQRGDAVGVGVGFLALLYRDEFDDASGSRLPRGGRRMSDAFVVA